jgi:hypothetical protein
LFVSTGNNASTQKGRTNMTTSKKTTSQKSPAKKGATKEATITISQIALKAGRSPKVLRAIARNEHARVASGKALRLPKPVAKHVYRAKDVPAFLEAIKGE